MRSEHDPWYVNIASVAILILVVACCFFAVAYVASQSKLWLVPAILAGSGIALVAVFSRIRRNIIESLKPRIKYQRKALNRGFMIMLLVLLPVLITIIIQVLKSLER
jgi:hypothetical protein